MIRAALAIITLSSVALAMPEPPPEDPIQLADGMTINVIWDDGTPEEQHTHAYPGLGLSPESLAGYLGFSEGGYQHGGLFVEPEVGAKMVKWRYWANGRCERLTHVWDGDSWVEEERMWGAWSYS